MRSLRELLEQVHERSLWQVLGVYLAGGWVGLEVIDILVDRGIFPERTFTLGLVLLLIGLPIVLLTAYVQKGLHTRPRADRTGLGRIFTWRNAVLGGVGAFALWGVFAAVWLLAFGGPEGPETSGGELMGIAVLPFRVDVSGGGLDAWGEGIPTFLSTNLDGVGGFRKIDPRSLHTVWRREIGRESIDPAAIIDFARRRGAAYALVGDLVGANDRVALSVEVYDIEAGRPSGPAVRVDGPADDILALVDELSIEILRAGLIPADAELPVFDLTAATTPSLEALRVFVEGEQEYRRSMYAAAIEHFNEAVQLDPEFPLALFRLATSHALEGRIDIAREYAERALSNADRLPVRERRLLEGYAAYARGEDTAIELLREYTRRYPDDTEGWFLLGEAYYDIGRARLEPLERFEEAALKAIERNPYYGPPYINLIDEAFHRGDQATAIDLVERYAQIDRGTDWCVGYQVAAGLAWGDEETSRETIAVLDTVSGDPLSCVQRSLVMNPALWEAYGVAWDEQVTRDTFDPPLRADARLWRFYGMAQRGRFAEASRSLEDVFGTAPVLATARAGVRWLIEGYEDPLFRSWAGVLGTAPDDLWRLALIAAGDGRPGDAEAHIRALRVAADSISVVPDSVRVGQRTGEQIARIADATTALIELRRTPADSLAISRAAEALRHVPAFERHLSAAMRYGIGRALVESGRYDEARPYFGSFVWTDQQYTTPKQYWLGRIHEGLGDIAQARVHYGNFVTWWEDADPPFHEWREEARDRLGRLLEAESGGG
ncbi:MAG: tetratricopeptide repeat protein [Gemmatimonadota bacterium]|nr:tetratricopeptide repeat protein [Gemmatimonadota bacterium]